MSRTDVTVNGVTAVADLEHARNLTTLALIAHLTTPRDDSLGVLADCMRVFVKHAQDSAPADVVAQAIATWGALDGEDALALAEEFEPGISVLAAIPGVAQELARLT